MGILGADMRLGCIVMALSGAGMILLISAVYCCLTGRL